MVPALGIACMLCITALIFKIDKNNWTTKNIFIFFFFSLFCQLHKSFPAQLRCYKKRPGDGSANSTIACCLRQGHLQLRSRLLMFWLNILVPRVLWGCRLSQMATRAAVITEGVRIQLLYSVLSTRWLVYLRLYLSMASQTLSHRIWVPK